jgi:hypothetical protein
MIVMDRQSRASKNTMSAIYSSLSALTWFLARMDRKDRTQLVMSRILAMPVISSMLEEALNFDILMEVSTMRQKPSRLAEVLRIWGDLLCGTIHNRLIGMAGANRVEV